MGLINKKTEQVHLAADADKQHKEPRPSDLEDLTSDTSSDAFAVLAAKEANHDIKFRTMSWQKTTLLLFSEYVCLAILALPWSFSVLGWGVGLVVQIVMGLLTWYTSYTLWQWCIRYPDAHDVCEVASHLFPRFPRLAYEATAIMLLLNNIMLVGFHVFTGAKILNTLSDHSVCTIGFQAVAAIIGVIVSLPRTLAHVSSMGVVSAICMAISILLALIFSGIEPNPRGGYGGDYPALGPVHTVGGIPPVLAVAKKTGELVSSNLTFVDGVNAFLNITFLWIGQILYPSFIAEMREPRDFPKALAALTALEMALFLVVSVVGYYYLGQYAQAPMIGSLLSEKHRKAAFAFVLVPTVVIGAIYSNVTAKIIYRRILGNSRHAHSNTVLGWGTWIAVTIGIWGIGFILGNVIPSMADFLSILSAAFDSFFGFIFWAIAYFHIYRDRLWKGPIMIALTVLNIVIFVLGLFMLGPGLYTSVEAIKLDYSGDVRHPFSCADNAL